MEVIIVLFVFLFYLLMIGVAVISSLISQLFIGVAIGAIPVMCGFVKKKQGLGWAGLALSVVLYWFFGFWLAQIASAVFTFLIIKDDKKEIAE